MGEAKMSKTLGNVVRPRELVERFGCDQVRYFLMREMAFGLDANFSYQALIQRINADLANDLGNLVFRTLTMVNKYFQGVVPHPSPPEPDDQALWALGQQALRDYLAYMEAFEFHRALASVWELVRAANRYVDHQAPWSLVKEGKRERVATVMYYLLESLRVIAIALWPVIPSSSERILQNLGLDPKETLSQKALFEFGLLPPGVRIKRGNR
jgi:methionyl-tRNA synthetase